MSSVFEARLAERATMPLLQFHTLRRSNCDLRFRGFALFGALAIWLNVRTSLAEPANDGDAATTPERTGSAARARPRRQRAQRERLVPIAASQRDVLSASRSGLALERAADVGESNGTSEEAAAADAASSDSENHATPRLELGAGAYLWYYQPLALAARRNAFELYDARLDVDATWGVFGFHLEPHVRDTRLRPYYDGPAWVQQAYAFLQADTFVVKLGKLYSRLGLFWDDSFYGNIQAFDGIKLDPDYGLSLEGAFGSKLGLRYVAQFFVTDGRTNISLQNRDTVSIAGARRANEALLRVEPFALPSATTELALGVSGESFRAELPTTNDEVLRFAIDLKARFESIVAWAEVLRQIGRSVTDFPYPALPASATSPALPGRASSHNDYLMLGAKFSFDRLSLRYGLSAANYRDVSVHEWLHVPGVDFAIERHLKLLLELAIWSHSTPSGTSLLDRSLNLTLAAEL